MRIMTNPNRGRARGGPPHGQVWGNGSARQTEGETRVNHTPKENGSDTVVHVNSSTENGGDGPSQAENEGRQSRESEPFRGRGGSRGFPRGGYPRGGPQGAVNNRGGFPRGRGGFVPGANFDRGRGLPFQPRGNPRGRGRGGASSTTIPSS